MWVDGCPSIVRNQEVVLPQFGGGVREESSQVLSEEYHLLTLFCFVLNQVLAV